MRALRAFAWLYLVGFIGVPASIAVTVLMEVAVAVLIVNAPPTYPTESQASVRLRADFPARQGGLHAAN